MAFKGVFWAEQFDDEVWGNYWRAVHQTPESVGIYFDSLRLPQAKVDRAETQVDIHTTLDVFNAKEALEAMRDAFRRLSLSYATVESAIPNLGISYTEEKTT